MTTQTDGRRVPDRPSALLTIAAAAARLGCSDMHIYRLIAAGELDAVDISQPGARKAKTRVSEANLASYIKARTRRAIPSSPGTPAA
jgi:excisionase family DNA binding protein